MTTAKPQVARVWVDYSQYQVAAGPDVGASEDTVPGLLLGLGDQAVAIITGLQWGKISVTAQAIPTSPPVFDTGWDVVAETDLVCPEGVIAVCDWSGPAHDELGKLALAGPGRYRLRIHARNRKQVSETESAEEHHLLVWPTDQPAPPQLLTPMDAYGLIFNGEQPPDVPALDALDATAAAAVRRLVALVTQIAPPELSGELTTVHVEAVAPATPRKVWNHVSNPWHWVGLGGSTNPARFHIYLNNEPELNVMGEFVVNEPLTHLAYTWSWTTNRWAEAETQVPVLIRGDLVTGEIPR